MEITIRLGGMIDGQTEEEKLKVRSSNHQLSLENETEGPGRLKSSMPLQTYDKIGGKELLVTSTSDVRRIVQSSGTSFPEMGHFVFR